MMVRTALAARRFILCGVVLSLLQGARAEAEPAASATAFDHPAALSSYALGGAGSYESAGVGGRVRWEFLPQRLGVDLYMDAMVVDWPGAFRHDHIIGFSLYSPFSLSARVRLRPLFGACVNFSFIAPEQSGAPSSNDVLFGLHAGAGLEVAAIGPLTWFIDAQAIWYVGHARTAGVWSGAVSGSLASTFSIQPTTGLQVHFG